MEQAAEPRPAGPGPLAGIALGAGLGVAVFLLAALVHDRLFPPSGPPGAPADFTAGGDPRAGVRVLRGDVAPGVAAVLLPLREDGAATRPEEGILDRALFPGGPPRRWMRLLLSVEEGGEPFTLSLAPGAVTLAGAGGEEGGLPPGNEDLAAAVRERGPALSAHRLLDLRVARADAGTVTVAPGSSARILLAFPPGSRPEAAGWATLPGGGRLFPVEVTTESLRTALDAGDPGRLREARTAEVVGVPARDGDRGRERR